MEIIDKVALIYLREKKILAARSGNKDSYYIPGGKREAGESDLKTLAREIKEELRVELDESSVKPYGTFQAQAHGKAEGTLVRIVCYSGEFTGTPAAGAEIAELAWLGYADRDKVSPAMRLVFEDLRAGGLLF